MIGTYGRLRVNVWASDVTVIRAARKKLNRAARRDPRYRVERKKFYRAMLETHHRHQALCTQFAL